MDDGGVLKSSRCRIICFRIVVFPTPPTSVQDALSDHSGTPIAQTHINALIDGYDSTGWSAAIYLSRYL